MHSGLLSVHKVWMQSQMVLAHVPLGAGGVLIKSGSGGKSHEIGRRAIVRMTLGMRA